MIKADASYEKKDETKFNILEMLGYAYKKMSKQEKAAEYLLAAYNLDEEKLFLTKELDRRNRLLSTLAECYEDIGQKNTARLYRKKVGTFSGQGR